MKEIFFKDENWNLECIYIYDIYTFPLQKNKKRNSNNLNLLLDQNLKEKNGQAQKNI